MIIAIGRLLSYVTKKTKKKYLNRVVFIPVSPEDIYPLLRLSFQAQIVFLVNFIYNVCQNNLKIEYFIHKRFSNE